MTYLLPIILFTCIFLIVFYQIITRGIKYSIRIFTRYWYREAESIIFNKEDEDEHIKILSRTPSSFITRKSVRDYVDYLENGHGNRIELWFFKMYTHYIPEYYRNKDNECAVNNILPNWMEIIIKIYKNKYIRRGCIIIALFIFCVLTSHLWIGGGDNIIEQSSSKELSHILDFEIGSCFIVDDHFNSSYCFTNKEGDIFNILDDDHRRDKSYINDEYHPLYANNITYSFIDENEHTYYRMNVINHVELKSVVSELLIDQQEILFILDNIKIEEKGIESCICPIFLNIIENITFFYDATHWTIMYSPSIYRNNTLSDLVQSTVDYNKKSLYFDKNKNIQELFEIEHIIHHDSFIVEYSSFSHQVDKTKELMEINKKIDDHYLINKAESNQPFIILNRNIIMEEERKKIQFTGSNAICFIYCDTLNKRLLL